MSKGLVVVRTVKDLRKRLVRWRKTGRRLALVPTMGALHEGHLSLVDHAHEVADRVIVTIFVNPTQFGPNEDLDRYPRDEAADLVMLRKRKAHLVFAPSVEEMYPDRFSTKVSVTGLDQCLCGASRPGHFDGVATVVSKLLNQARADIAVFGQKDYQQLLIIRRMARDLDIETRIDGAPTVREDDGLALSSRNKYLNAKQRQLAPQLHAAITSVAKKIEDGASAPASAGSAAQALEKSGFKVDYLEVRDADTLEPIAGKLKKNTNARVFVAAYLGKTRLIDNVAAEAG